MPRVVCDRSTRRLFLQALGGVYLVAVLSLWVQVHGLIGERGLLPVGRYLLLAGNQLGPGAWRSLPTLC